MKRIVLFFCMLPVYDIALAQQQIKTGAQLDQVVVYRAGAELTHHALLSVRPGSTEIVINNVANTLDEKSIRISAPAGITIMSVVFSRDYLQPEDDVKSPEYLQTEQQLKATQRKLTQINNEIAGETNTLALLEENKKVAGDRVNINVEELKKLAAYYQEKQLDIMNHLAILQEDRNTLTDEVNKLSAQLQEINNQLRNNGGRLVLQVMSNAVFNDQRITLSYVSANAGWTPFYDLRADNTTGPLKLVYKANVVQNTGIDWKQVRLTLSTGNTAAGGTMPVLSTWFLRYNNPYASIYKEEASAAFLNKPTANFTTMLEGQAAGLTVTAGNGNGAPGAADYIRIRGVASVSGGAEPLYVVDGAPVSVGALNNIRQDDILDVKVLKDASATAVYGARGSNGVVVVSTKGKGVDHFTTLTENQMTATFDIDMLYDIESNSKPHAVSLKEYSRPAHYQYYAIPRLDPDAFLVAEMTGYESLNLLPGEANVIFENMYVGKSFLNPYTVNDTMTQSMGRDRGIVIKREKIVDQSGSRMIGSNKKQTYTFEIRVKNSKKESISLKLKDQYPVATDRDMDIELLEASQAAVNKETGELSWNMDLRPGETKTVRISYSVKYPKDKWLANL